MNPSADRDLQNIVLVDESKTAEQNLAFETKECLGK